MNRPFLALTSSVFISLVNLAPGQTAPTGNDNIGGVSAPAGTFNFSPSVSLVGLNPYTANVTRVVDDISTYSVSEVGLDFKRYYNSRGNPGSQQMGNASAWRYSFQWDFTVTTVGSSTSISVVYPEGTAITFSQNGTNTWTAPSPVMDVITLQGTTYTLTTAKNIHYNFSVTSGYGQLNTITDSKGLTTTFAYSYRNSPPSLITTISEPGGRSMLIQKQMFNTDNQGDGTYWVSYVGVSDGRYVTYNYTTANTYHQSSPPIAYYSCVLSSIVDTDTTANTNVTAATYSYKALTTGSNANPVGFCALSGATDSYAVGLPSISYTYFTGGSNPLGAINSVRVNGSTVCTLSLNGGNMQTPEVTFPDGSYFIYQINSGAQGGLLSSITNSSTNANNKMLFAYTSGSGTWTTSVTDSNNNVTSSTFSSIGKLLSMTLPPTGSETIGPTLTWNYNTAGYLTSTKDANQNLTTLTRDPNSNLVTQISYPDSTSEIYTYNSFAQPLSHTQRNQGVEYFTYDSTGLMLTYQDAVQSASRCNTYAYSSYARVQTATDADGNPTSYAYDFIGDVKKMTHADSSTVSYTYNNKKVTSVTNELGYTTNYKYDGFERLLSVTDPLNHATTYAYDPSTPTNPNPITVTLASGKITQNTFTPVWSYLLSSSTVGYGTSAAATTSYGYDNVGNVTSIQDPRGYNSYITYDARNRKHSFEDPHLNTTTYSYDDNSNLLTVVTPTGTTTKRYDVVNRMTSVTDPNGKTSHLAYDFGDSISSYNDPDNHHYSYTYDSDERELTMTYPDSTSETYTYDAAGNNLTYETRDSKTATFSYDNRNRVTGCSWNDGVTPAFTESYDSASRVTAISNSNSALAYTYDNANKALSETENITGLASKQVSYAYNNDDTPSQLTYPDNTVLTYGYDARNDVSSIAQGGTQVVGYTYDLAGNRISKTLANGVASTLTYDSNERLTSIVDTTPSPTSGTSLQRFDYGYDSMSRRTYVQRNSALGDTYSYDYNSQVTSVAYNATNPATTPTNPSQTVGYSFDPSGNRTSVTDSLNGSTGYSINGDNQYTIVGGLSLSYDLKRNLKTYAGWTYAYDSQNRMTSATNGTNSTTFAYDPIGRCVSRNQNGTISYFVYDSNWRLMAEYNSSGAQTNRYVEGPLVDEVLSRTDSTNTVVYFSNDGAGSVTKLTSSAGAILEQYSYDIYGMPTITNSGGTVLSGSAYNNRFFFTGREYLVGLGIYDYRDRMYSPLLGRFLQPDPAELASDSYNIQRYCGNDPVNFADPSGLQVAPPGTGSNGASPYDTADDQMAPVIVTGSLIPPDSLPPVSPSGFPLQVGIPLPMGNVAGAGSTTAVQIKMQMPEQMKPIIVTGSLIPDPGPPGYTQGFNPDGKFIPLAAGVSFTPRAKNPIDQSTQIRARQAMMRKLGKPNAIDNINKSTTNENKFFRSLTTDDPAGEGSIAEVEAEEIVGSGAEELAVSPAAEEGLLSLGQILEAVLGDL